MNIRKFMRMLRRGCVFWAIYRMMVLLRIRADRMKTRNIRLTSENERLTRLAHFDALTGILNRVGFSHEWDRFSSEIVRHHWESGALLFIDLNGFKPVNDHLGHATGDKALVEVARALMSALRPGDSVARIGGDEFAVLLPGASVLGTSIVIERLRTAVRATLMWDEDFINLARIEEREFALDFSAGIYFVEFGIHPERLDIALAQAESRMPKMAERRDLFTRHLCKAQ